MATKPSLVPSPFLFTSEKELQNSDGKWYPMWLNPQTFNFTYKPNSSEQLTNTGYEFYHWQNSLPTISFSGVSGWLFSEASQEGEQNTTITYQLTSSLGTTITAGDIFTPALSTAFGGNSVKEALRTAATTGLESPPTANLNSARLFFERLQRVATQEKFFYDSTLGYERFNLRKLIIFTKAQPDGKELLGIFKSFTIQEGKEDSQMIPYNCTFLVFAGLEEIGSGGDEIQFLQKFSSNSFFGLRPASSTLG